ncbi:hypothetical protein C8R28_10676 [Nitrosomonas ureae]|uniref:Uncharacterized protein n=1 Tax=Nitrosomonas ureae TaxID=44577 RepID=A0A2T5I2Z6_9PROT|nr:hypothetical protein C8R28_10676 [Nitrosomonas ureae]
MRANGNEIGPGLGIIIPLQSNRFAAMDSWVVGHGVWVIVGIVGENDYLPLRIIAIDQIDDDFHHRIFFLGFAFGNQ